jgi:hypothetical protein
MSFSRSEWASRKATIAEHLNRGECGGSYAEAIIVLCSAISAMASEVWPGSNIDRKRFVQFVIEFSNQSSVPATISMPLLVGHLRDDGNRVDSEKLNKAFVNFDPSRIVIDRDVDRNEDEVLVLCPGLSRSYLRRFSYANILYERVRSPFVHEYHPGERTTSWPMTEQRDACVSYVNWVYHPDRHIFIHADWLVALTRELGVNAEHEAKSFSRQSPTTWWVEG